MQRQKARKKEKEGLQGFFANLFCCSRPRRIIPKYKTESSDVDQDKYSPNSNEVIETDTVRSITYPVSLFMDDSSNNDIVRNSMGDTKVQKKLLLKAKSSKRAQRPKIFSVQKNKNVVVNLKLKKNCVCLKCVHCRRRHSQSVCFVKRLINKNHVCRKPLEIIPKKKLCVMINSDLTFKVIKSKHRHTNSVKTEYSNLNSNINREYRINKYDLTNRILDCKQNIEGINLQKMQTKSFNGADKKRIHQNLIKFMDNLQVLKRNSLKTILDAKNYRRQEFKETLQKAVYQECIGDIPYKDNEKGYQDNIRLLSSSFRQPSEQACFQGSRHCSPFSNNLHPHSPIINVKSDIQDKSSKSKPNVKVSVNFQIIRPSHDLSKKCKKHPNMYIEDTEIINSDHAIWLESSSKKKLSPRQKYSTVLAHYDLHNSLFLQLKRKPKMFDIRRTSGQHSLLQTNSSKHMEEILKPVTTSKPHETNQEFKNEMYQLKNVINYVTVEPFRTIPTFGMYNYYNDRKLHPYVRESNKFTSVNFKSHSSPNILSNILECNSSIRNLCESNRKPSCYGNERFFNCGVCRPFSNLRNCVKQWINYETCSTSYLQMFANDGLFHEASEKDFRIGNKHSKTSITISCSNQSYSLSCTSSFVLETDSEAIISIFDINGLYCRDSTSSSCNQLNDTREYQNVKEHYFTQQLEENISKSNINEFTSNVSLRTFSGTNLIKLISSISAIIKNQNKTCLNALNYSNSNSVLPEKVYSASKDIVSHQADDSIKVKNQKEVPYYILRSRLRPNDSDSSQLKVSLGAYTEHKSEKNNYPVYSAEDPLPIFKEINIPELDVQEERYQLPINDEQTINQPGIESNIKFSSDVPLTKNLITYKDKLHFIKDKENVRYQIILDPQRIDDINSFTETSKGSFQRKHETATKKLFHNKSKQNKQSLQVDKSGTKITTYKPCKPSRRGYKHQRGTREASFKALQSDSSRSTTKRFKKCSMETCNVQSSDASLEILLTDENVKDQFQKSENALHLRRLSDISETDLVNSYTERQQIPEKYKESSFEHLVQMYDKSTTCPRDIQIDKGNQSSIPRLEKSVGDISTVEKQASNHSNIHGLISTQNKIKSAKNEQNVQTVNETSSHKRKSGEMEVSQNAKTKRNTTEKGTTVDQSILNAVSSSSDVEINRMTCREKCAACRKRRINRPRRNKCKIKTFLNIAKNNRMRNNVFYVEEALDDLPIIKEHEPYMENAKDESSNSSMFVDEQFLDTNINLNNTNIQTTIKKDQSSNVSFINTLTSSSDSMIDKVTGTNDLIKTKTIRSDTTELIGNCNITGKKLLEHQKLSKAQLPSNAIADQQTIKRFEKVCSKSQTKDYTSLDKGNLLMTVYQTNPRVLRIINSLVKKAEEMIRIETTMNRRKLANHTDKRLSPNTGSNADLESITQETSCSDASIKYELCPKNVASAEKRCFYLEHTKDKSVKERLSKRKDTETSELDTNCGPYNTQPLKVLIMNKQFITDNVFYGISPQIDNPRPDPLNFFNAYVRLCKEKSSSKEALDFLRASAEMCKNRPPSEGLFSTSNQTNPISKDLFTVFHNYSKVTEPEQSISEDQLDFLKYCDEMHKDGSSSDVFLKIANSISKDSIAPANTYPNIKVDGPTQIAAKDTLNVSPRICNNKSLTDDCETLCSNSALRIASLDQDRITNSEIISLLGFCNHYSYKDKPPSKDAEIIPLLHDSLYVKYVPTKKASEPCSINCPRAIRNETQDDSLMHSRFTVDSTETLQLRSSSLFDVSNNNLKGRRVPFKHEANCNCKDITLGLASLNVCQVDNVTNNDRKRNQAIKECKHSSANTIMQPRDVNTASSRNVIFANKNTGVGRSNTESTRYPTETVLRSINQQTNPNTRLIVADKDTSVERLNKSDCNKRTKEMPSRVVCTQLGNSSNSSNMMSRTCCPHGIVYSGIDKRMPGSAVNTPTGSYSKNFQKQIIVCRKPLPYQNQFHQPAINISEQERFYLQKSNRELPNFVNPDVSPTYPYIEPEDQHRKSKKDCSRRSSKHKSQHKSRSKHYPFLDPAPDDLYGYSLNRNNRCSYSDSQSDLPDGCSYCEESADDEWVDDGVPRARLKLKDLIKELRHSKLSPSHIEFVLELIHKQETEYCCYSDQSLQRSIGTVRTIKKIKEVDKAETTRHRRRSKKYHKNKKRDSGKYEAKQYGTFNGHYPFKKKSSCLSIFSSRHQVFEEAVSLVKESYPVSLNTKISSVENSKISEDNMQGHAVKKESKEDSNVPLEIASKQNKNDLRTFSFITLPKQEKNITPKSSAFEKESESHNEPKIRTNISSSESTSSKLDESNGDTKSDIESSSLALKLKKGQLRNHKNVSDKSSERGILLCEDKMKTEILSVSDNNNQKAISKILSMDVSNVAKFTKREINDEVSQTGTQGQWFQTVNKDLSEEYAIREILSNTSLLNRDSSTTYLETEKMSPDEYIQNILSNLKDNKSYPVNYKVGSSVSTLSPHRPRVSFADLEKCVQTSFTALPSVSEQCDFCMQADFKPESNPIVPIVQKCTQTVLVTPEKSIQVSLSANESPTNQSNFGVQADHKLFVDTKNDVSTCHSKSIFCTNQSQIGIQVNSIIPDRDLEGCTNNTVLKEYVPSRSSIPKSTLTPLTEKESNAPSIKNESPGSVSEACIRKSEYVQAEQSFESSGTFKNMSFDIPSSRIEQGEQYRVRPRKRPRSYSHAVKREDGNVRRLAKLKRRSEGGTRCNIIELQIEGKKRKLLLLPDVESENSIPNSVGNKMNSTTNPPNSLKVEESGKNSNSPQDYEDCISKYEQTSMNKPNDQVRTYDNKIGDIPFSKANETGKKQKPFNAGRSTQGSSHRYTSIAEDSDTDSYYLKGNLTGSCKGIKRKLDTNSFVKNGKSNKTTLSANEKLVMRRGTNRIVVIPTLDKSTQIWFVDSANKGSNTATHQKFIKKIKKYLTNLRYEISNESTENIVNFKHDELVAQKVNIPRTSLSKILKGNKHHVNDCNQTSSSTSVLSPMNIENINMDCKRDKHIPPHLIKQHSVKNDEVKGVDNNDAYQIEEKKDQHASFIKENKPDETNFEIEVNLNDIKSTDSSKNTQVLTLSVFNNLDDPYLRDRYYNESLECCERIFEQEHMKSKSKKNGDSRNSLSKNNQRSVLVNESTTNNLEDRVSDGDTLEMTMAKDLKKCTESVATIIKKFNTASQTTRNKEISPAWRRQNGNTHKYPTLVVNEKIQNQVHSLPMNRFDSYTYSQCCQCESKQILKRDRRKTNQKDNDIETLYFDILLKTSSDKIYSSTRLESLENNQTMPMKTITSNTVDRKAYEVITPYSNCFPENTSSRTDKFKKNQLPPGLSDADKTITLLSVDVDTKFDDVFRKSPPSKCFDTRGIKYYDTNKIEDLSSSMPLIRKLLRKSGSVDINRINLNELKKKKDSSVYSNLRNRKYNRNVCVQIDDARKRRPKQKYDNGTRAISAISQDSSENTDSGVSNTSTERNIGRNRNNKSRRSKNNKIKQMYKQLQLDKYKNKALPPTDASMGVTLTRRPESFRCVKSEPFKDIKDNLDEITSAPLLLELLKNCNIIFSNIRKNKHLLKRSMDLLKFATSSISTLMGLPNVISKNITIKELEKHIRRKYPMVYDSGVKTADSGNVRSISYNNLNAKGELKDNKNISRSREQEMYETTDEVFTYCALTPLSNCDDLYKPTKLTHSGVLESLKGDHQARDMQSSRIAENTKCGNEETSYSPVALLNKVRPKIEKVQEIQLAYDNIEDNNEEFLCSSSSRTQTKNIQFIKKLTNKPIECSQFGMKTEHGKELQKDSIQSIRSHYHQTSKSGAKTNNSLKRNMKPRSYEKLSFLKKKLNTSSYRIHATQKKYVPRSADYDSNQKYSFMNVNALSHVKANNIRSKMHSKGSEKLPSVSKIQITNASSNPKLTTHPNKPKLIILDMTKYVPIIDIACNTASVQTAVVTERACQTTLLSVYPYIYKSFQDEVVNSNRSTDFQVLSKPMLPRSVCNDQKILKEIWPNLSRIDDIKVASSAKITPISLRDVDNLDNLEAGKLLQFRSGSFSNTTSFNLIFSSSHNLETTVQANDGSFQRDNEHNYKESKCCHQQHYSFSNNWFYEPKLSNVGKYDPSVCSSPNGIAFDLKSSKESVIINSSQSVFYKHESAEKGKKTTFKDVYENMLLRKKIDHEGTVNTHSIEEIFHSNVQKTNRKITNVGFQTEFSTEYSVPISFNCRKQETPKSKSYYDNCSTDIDTNIKTRDVFYLKNTKLRSWNVDMISSSGSSNSISTTKTTEIINMCRQEVFCKQKRAASQKEENNFRTPPQKPIDIWQTFCNKRSNGQITGNFQRESTHAYHRDAVTSRHYIPKTVNTSSSRPYSTCSKEFKTLFRPRGSFEPETYSRSDTLSEFESQVTLTPSNRDCPTHLGSRALLTLFKARQGQQLQHRKKY